MGWMFFSIRNVSNACLALFVFLTLILHILALAVDHKGGLSHQQEFYLETRASSASSTSSRLIITKSTGDDEPPPYGVFDIRIRDSEGVDISERISVRHHHHRPIRSTLTQRDSRPLRTCPHPYWPDFGGSTCLRTLGSRKYTVICSSLHQTSMFFDGDCADSEICVDGISWPTIGEEHTAYCVSTNNFVKIAEDQLTQSNGATRVADFTAVGSHSGYAVEAVMTGLDSTSCVFVQSLVVQAQSYNTVLDTKIWRTLENGVNQCTNCASVGIQPVPMGTQRIKVDVVLKDTTTAALLYLASVVAP